MLPTPGEPVRRPGVGLILAALAAVAWAVARAQVQSVTVDEADSYLMFAARGWPAVLDAGSGNHVLNTLLAWFTTRAFGLSHLSLRAPALLGAALHAAASLALCVRVGRTAWVRWLLFVCLVWNPFVMDYMVAARGYSLALAFLMAAVWSVGESRLGLASCCAALSFCANFSFAYVDGALMVAAAVQAWRGTGGWRAPAACLLPGAAIALVLCGWTLSRWPGGELFYGATSVRESWDSLSSATFDAPNPALVPPRLARVLEAAGPALAWLLLAMTAWQAGRILRHRQPLGVVLVSALVTAAAGHWLQFELAGIPLPRARTGLFFVPLALLVVGIGAALPSASRWGALPRRAAVAVLGLSALYFAGCLRLSYFKEWRFDAETKQAFLALERAHGQRPLREVGADWRYSDALNFYRECLHDREIGPFREGDPLAPGKSAYVLYSPEAQDFVRGQGLQVIYRGPLSDVLVVVRP